MKKVIFLFIIFADRNLKNIYIMTINGKKQVFTFTAAVLSFFICEASAQTFKWYQTTENNEWKQTKVRLNSKGTDGEKLNSDATAAQSAVPFRTFGTTFNEQDWKAFSMLKEAEQDEIMKNLFSPDGDLHFTRGRISMNANDYALGWYSCDSVDGDFELKHFNIDRDKTTIIPLIHHAQKYNSQMRFWISPWSPPAWMKINHDYPVLSSKWNTQPKEKDYLLYASPAGGNQSMDEVSPREDMQGTFPHRLATQDYFIQDSRYLQTYANMFGKFVDLYGKEGVVIDRVMYQNEAYSYTVYPGCAWTLAGTIRFNKDYLIPTLARTNPDVEVYIGTFNTNRKNLVEKILSGLPSSVKGIGLQWEGRQIMGSLREKHPGLHYICSESECGNGSMDWKAGEHTFFLISDNLGNGCDEYYNWNFILADNGMSAWGWNQNALIQVDSKKGSFRYTPEYFAYKHFSHFLTPGTKMVAYNNKGRERFGNMQRSNEIYLLMFVTPEGKHIVTAGNFSDKAKAISVAIGKKFLNASIPVHSFNTFIE